MIARTVMGATACSTVCEEQPEYHANFQSPEVADDHLLLINVVGYVSEVLGMRER
jgi:hypothetical protein